MTLSKVSINANSTIFYAMKKMSTHGQKCLLITHKGKLLGTLSDGDIRKGILSGKTLDTKIDGIYNKKPFSIEKGLYDEEKIRKIFQKKRLDIIPIVDEKGLLVKTYTNADFLTKKLAVKKLKVPVVIMAGGKGTRLKPFTNILPKPLIPLKDMTVIEKIIESFTHRGFFNFTLSVNYKGKILKAFFEELEPKYSLNFIEEKEALGTAGALFMLKRRVKETFILTNCDVIFDFDFNDLLKNHKESKALITLVASAKKVTIPYGVCNLSENGLLGSLSEKPTTDYLINTGFYVIEPSVLKLIPNNKFMHITDLIDKLIARGEIVNIFPIEDRAWIDIGQWAEYKDAVKRLS
jgi:dTDP-glucose pyrophosphorylase